METFKFRFSAPRFNHPQAAKLAWATAEALVQWGEKMRRDYIQESIDNRDVIGRALSYILRSTFSVQEKISRVAKLFCDSKTVKVPLHSYYGTRLVAPFWENLPEVLSVESQNMNNSQMFSFIFEAWQKNGGGELIARQMDWEVQTPKTSILLDEKVQNFFKKAESFYF